MTAREWSLRFHALNMSWENCVKTPTYFEELEALVAEHEKQIRKVFGVTYGK